MELQMNNTRAEISPDGSWKKKTALFLASQGLSLFGSMLVMYAIIWHITLTTQSGLFLTISTIASFLPQIVISLFAGVWADRYYRKFLIIVSDLLTAASTLVLAVAFLVGYQEIWLIILISAVRSIGAGIQAPAVNAFLPQIVPSEKLMRVNSINSTIHPIIMIIAPILSGAMMAISRLENIFFMDVLTAAAAVSLLLVLKVPAYQRAAQAQLAGYFDDLREGLRYIRQNRAIRTLFVFFGFTFFLITPVAFLTPLLIARSFGEEVWRLTANEITFFAGSILGGIVMTVWGGFQNRFRTIGFACIVWAVLFTALGLSRNFYVYLFFMFLSGFPMPFFNAPTITLLQEMVGEDMQGRVFSVQQMITNIAMPVGMLLFGPMADIVAVEVLLVMSSALMAIPGVWIFLNRQLKSREAAGAARDFEMQPGD